jgi:hypothetical protein
VIHGGRYSALSAEVANLLTNINEYTRISTGKIPSNVRYSLVHTGEKSLLNTKFFILLYRQTTYSRYNEDFNAASVPICNKYRGEYYFSLLCETQYSSFKVNGRFTATWSSFFKIEG